DDAVLSNRIDQFLQGFAGEILARLKRTGDDGGQIELVHSLARLASVSACCHRRSANQCAKPLAETRPCHVAEATGTVPPTQTAIRATGRRLAGARPSN